MNWWTAAIYGAAAVIALQGLLSLMTAHRRASLRRFVEEDVQRQQQETAGPVVSQSEQTANTSTKPKAA